ncbi:signal peptidase II [Geotoga petraea]|jgi:signal peptidase II|uniref:Lipoprotein signal peptidase n=1 Tax=Geotoga petraea TaxID=28234 RepID=A0A1G6I096_9BACT|nr:signal peptidase II [Geotoga petraea]SDB99881.1 signal peptidase II [Geotoga petraea]
MSFLIPLIILLDQITKILGEKYLVNNSIDIWFFKLTYTENTGMAFGLFQDNSFLLGIISSIIVSVLFFVREFYTKKIRSMYLDVGMIFIISGAMGNIFDRLRIGYVVDIFYIPYFSIFNVADSFVTVGGILLAIYFLRSNKYERRIYRFK